MRLLMMPTTDESRKEQTRREVQAIMQEMEEALYLTPGERLQIGEFRGILTGRA